MHVVENDVDIQIDPNTLMKNLKGNLLEQIISLKIMNKQVNAEMIEQLGDNF